MAALAASGKDRLLCRWLDERRIPELYPEFPFHGAESCIASGYFLLEARQSFQLKLPLGRPLKKQNDRYSNGTEGIETRRGAVFKVVGEL